MILAVEHWMKTFGVPINRDPDTIRLYSKLIQEELAELDAESGPSSAELHEVADLIWVSLAKALALGYDPLDIIDALVQIYASNMTKCSDNKTLLESLIDHDTQEIREASPNKFVVIDKKTKKILKGPFYKKADITLKHKYYGYSE